MKLKNLFSGKSVLSTLGPQKDTHPDNFWCDNLLLKSLIGSPKTVKGSFFCQGNELTSLEGGPSKVDGDYLASQNKLVSLKGSPESIQGDFYCSGNKLASLKDGPKIVSDKLICYNNKLTSLEGCPSSLYAISAHTNLLTSLKDIHKHIKHLDSFANFENNPITSHVLGLLRIKGSFDEVALDNKGVEEILNRHLKGDKDIFACQEELIAAGFEEYAQL